MTFFFRKLWCRIFGHRYVEDPGIERDGMTEPLYYKGWVPFCERCYSDIDVPSEGGK